jgi:mRNA interferase MazF
MVNQGDIVYLDFDPGTGHEQKGSRPALVISNSIFLKFSNLAMVCPITNTDKNHPFHVRLDDSTKTKGVILCDQARILDINARNFSFIEMAPLSITATLVDIVTSFLFFPDK